MRDIFEEGLFGENDGFRRLMDVNHIVCRDEFRELLDQLFPMVSWEVKKGPQIDRSITNAYDDGLNKSTKTETSPSQYYIEREEASPNKVVDHKGKDRFINDDPFKDMPKDFNDLVKRGIEKGIIKEKPRKREPRSIFEEIEKLFAEEKTEQKVHPFVFISNRLTFLIKTKYPIIWDTSSIKTVRTNSLFVALDKNDNPKITPKEASYIALNINRDGEIRKEITEALSGTEWKDIYCAPSYNNVKGELRFGFTFSLVH